MDKDTLIQEVWDPISDRIIRAMEKERRRKISEGLNMNKNDVLRRLYDEKKELDVKIGKLEKFLKHNIFSVSVAVTEEQLTLLIQQLEAMIEYRSILGSRIRLILAEQEANE